MQKMFMAVALVGSFLLSGCASPYKPTAQLFPSHIKKLFIKPFVNTTNQYGLEEKLTLAVIDEFIRDGRFAITNNEAEADGMLVGEISKYILQPLTYDANLVTQQYKLWILVNVYFVDIRENVTLWSEPNLEGIQIYNDATVLGGITDEEAREIIWDNMSRDIVKRTMDGFGSVTGASEKKVPQ